MRLYRRFNPFFWSRRTIIITTLAFFAITLPSFLVGLSAFATTINPPNATLKIPAINLTSAVTPTDLANNTLETPDSIIGSYTNNQKIFLFAHNTTSFKNLHNLKINDQILYQKDNEVHTYYATNIELKPVENVLMTKILKDTPAPTLILMTCSGQKQNGQYPDRLIIYAEQK